MKGKLNTNVLFAALLGAKSRKPAQPEIFHSSLLMHSLMRNRKPEAFAANQPTYRSVTALIH